MKIHRKLIALVAMLLLAPASLVAQISDTSPPSLVEFTISPATVDVSSTNQIITLTGRITDDLSGFGFSAPYFRSLASITFKGAGSDYFMPGITARFNPFTQVSGNEFDGVYKADLFVPAHSRTGVWTVASLTLIDNVGNGTNLIAADLRALGLPIGFTITGVEDRTPPQFVSLSLDPATVDTSTAGRSINVTARILEDFLIAGGYDQLGAALPGMATVEFLSPSKRQTAVGRLLRMSGDDHDGVYAGPLFLPQFTEPGKWQLHKAQLIDAAGNVGFLELGAALAQGMTAEFTVSGVGDTSPPTLRAFDIFPRWIGPPNTRQSIAVTARCTDDLAGMIGGYDENGGVFPGTALVQFRSPSGRQLAGGILYPAANRTGLLDVMFTNSVDFLQFCETGLWTVSYFSTKDGPGNTVQLDAATLRNLGYPAEIAVGISPPIAIALQENSILLSWPAWGEDFHLQSRDLDGVGASWMAIQTPPAIINDRLVNAVPITPAPQLFRLFH